jgi:hypothetical protein
MREQSPLFFAVLAGFRGVKGDKVAAKDAKRTVVIGLARMKFEGGRGLAEESLRIS